MRTIKHLIVSFMVAGFLFSGCTGSRQEALIHYVNPFIGTDVHGHTFPGATTPFGMVQLSPDNNHEGWDWCSGYHYSWDTIAVFSHTHLSGTGVPDLMDIGILPVDFPGMAGNTPVNFIPADKQYALFSHANETAWPGYYSVILNNGIKAELTTTTRTGMHRYTFPSGNQAGFILDLTSRVSWDAVAGTAIKVEGRDALSGYRFSKGWASNQMVFFYLKASKPFSHAGLIDSAGRVDASLTEKITAPGHAALKAFLQFDNKDQAPLLIKVGISSVSVDAARENLEKENPSWDFDLVKKQAENAWEEALASVRIRSNDSAMLRTFYTAMYHAFIQPNTYSDLNGMYRTAAGEIKKASGHTMYYTFSLWDTFRAWHPLMTIIAPEKVREFVQAMMAHYRDNDLLPKWTLWGNETNCMIGYHSVPVLVDAWKKGLLKDLDHEEIYRAMRKVAMGEGPQRALEGLDAYMKYGYLPADANHRRSSKTDYDESVSRTLEWAYDDWCIAQMAKDLGKEEDYQHFMQRAGYYRNLADPTCLLMRPRNADKSWATPFRPEVAEHGNGYTEGNAWQYSWFVPQDIQGLIEFMGGKNRFAERLDTLFDHLKAEDIHFPDVTGLIGQYAHGNEPSHHVAYLYNYAGYPWKTQERVRHIMKTMYNDKPDGLSGNEDCGQMSAWYVLSAIGFYPVNPCGGVYVIGSPLVDEAVISVGGGKTFTVSVRNQAPENLYIQSAILNGKPYNTCWIDHQTLQKGGTLELFMGSSPNKEWGLENPLVK